MKKRVFRRAADDPARLCELLAERLGWSIDAAIALIDRGGVYLERERVTEPRHPIAVGEKLTVHLAPAAAIVPPIAVVYRDEELAVVEKPAGLPSQAQLGQRTHSLDALATRALGGEARLMHRLDKGASGLVLVALHKRSYAPLQRAMSEHAIDRRYAAIVGGNLVGEGVIRKRIGRHPADQRLRTPLPEDAPAGEPACTRYRVVGHGTLDKGAVTAVDLLLETGRTHQLRVHLASLAHPIVGDAAYGGPPFSRLCLHAYALELAHPRNGKPIRVSIGLPDSFSQLVPNLTRLFT